LRRGSPLLSPLSIGFTLLLFAGLAIAIWRTGGLGFNPGPLSAKSLPGTALQGFTSHAGFEAHCEECHRPTQTQMAALCMRCHQTVLSQVASKTGVHGRLTNLGQCAACHPEHQGRGFDPTAFALARFDHTTAGFPLLGKHALAQCAACHSDNRYNPTPRTCADCHAQPKEHAGMFGVDCATCHSSDAWKPAVIKGAVFDHSLTAFTLAHHATGYDGQPILCTGCHLGQTTAFDAAACTSCHTQHDAAFMAKHQQQYGVSCLQCHDGADRMHAFDHAAFFPLDGKHAALDCTACHADQRFKGTPTRCASCHQEPAIHAGFFGLRCGDCHISSAWTPALLKTHGFPLDHGGQGAVACLTCHTQKYQEYTCFGCHDHQAAEITASHTRVGIPAAEISQCDRCHVNGVVEKKK
jgi:hypothetical protein